MAVIDPLLHHETAQPPAYPAVQIPQDARGLDESIVSDPSSDIDVQLFDNLLQVDTPGPARDLLDPVFGALQGLVREFYPEVPG